MDEPLKTIIPAFGAAIASILLFLSTQIIGKITARQAATKAKEDTESQRNKSEETFRTLFAEERNARVKLEKRVRRLIHDSNIRDEEVVKLRKQVVDLEGKIKVIEKERDDALDKLRGIV